MLMPNYYKNNGFPLIFPASKSTGQEKYLTKIEYNPQIQNKIHQMFFQRKYL